MKSDDLGIQILTISKKLGLPTHKILDFIWALKDGRAVENNSLISETGVSKNVLNKIKEELSNILEPPTKYTKLKDESAPAIMDLFSKNFSKTEDLIHSINPVIDSKVLSQRPNPLRDFDQFIATEKTVLKRVGIMSVLDDIQNKNILFLGDDDFTSVITASIFQAKSITVVDIDERILSKISEISQNNKLNIQVVKADIKNPFPGHLHNKFDVVYTDPPYTSEGIELFVSRAISAIDMTNASARIYICYGNSDRAKERFLPVYKTLLDSGLMIRYIFDKFNRYSNAESIGNSSTLFITEVTPKTKPIIQGSYDKSIYTNN